MDDITSTFTNYVSEVSRKYFSQESTEYTYRSDLEKILKDTFAEIKVKEITQEAKSKDRNKPDFVISKNKVSLLYVETKDVGISLDKIEKSEQMTRYYGYANLVLTDYLEFRFYRNGLPYGEPIHIGEIDKNKKEILPLTNNFELLSRTLIEFSQSYKEPIKSGSHLAKIMAGKAQRIKDNMREYLQQESDKNDELIRVYEMIKKLLVNDMSYDSFADMYAQTLVYGLFVARYNDKSSDTFTRQEAAELIPESNPFLMNFFDHIAGIKFDKRLKYIVDELCEVFSHSDVKKLMNDYIKDEDPVIHFYEDFLQEYDPELKRRMGAYYTPQPVVDFIVKSVDYLLKKDFKLSKGLSDTSKSRNGDHIVQVLDPAVGTGTFISAVIRTIYKDLLDSGQKGRWHKYVHNDLLPRIHGFEIMMAPYTIAHLKLGIAFEKTGFIHFNKRLGIYLTNSLEEGVIQPELLSTFGLADSIAKESEEALNIKVNTPVMVVLGNPPYSVSSSNKGEWITKLVNVYKQGLEEKNQNSLSDDYVKFIRYAECYMERNDSGLVAMITNNSFVDGIIHRQMRKHLLETFDDIYILNLHGNSKKKEVSPDGSKDENVFDIMQGVSINIFVKNNKKKEGEFANVYYEDLYGLREKKFEFLRENNIHNIKWKKLDLLEPYYFFVSKDFSLKDEYSKNIALSDLFPKYSSGIKSRNDGFLIANNFSKEDVTQSINLLHNEEKTDFIKRYKLTNTSYQKLKEKKDLFVENDVDNIQSIIYKPFDRRHMYYPLESISKIIPRGDSRVVLMKNVINRDNISLLTTRSIPQNQIFNRIFISKHLSDIHSISDQTYVFPLYLYNNDGTREPNLNPEILKEIEKITGKVTPEDILDYVYGILHNSKYREKYREFLKIDFPRIPYPKDKTTFKNFVKIGKELRELHLLESNKLDKYITTYPIDGNDKIEKVEYKDKKVYINDTQYFGNISEEVWNFYIGGYQPAQKWLKDRKGRELTSDDIDHYQRIIIALNETNRIITKKF